MKQKTVMIVSLVLCIYFAIMAVLVQNILFQNILLSLSFLAGLIALFMYISQNISKKEISSKQSWIFFSVFGVLIIMLIHGLITQDYYYFTYLDYSHISKQEDTSWYYIKMILDFLIATGFFYFGLKLRKVQKKR